MPCVPVTCGAADLGCICNYGYKRTGNLLYQTVSFLGCGSICEPDRLSALSERFYAIVCAGSGVFVALSGSTLPGCTEKETGFYARDRCSDHKSLSACGLSEQSILIF